MVTDAQKQALIEAACAVRENAYAPYSKFKVGAALLMEDGQIYTGANVENAAYGLSMCAERAALFKAASLGLRKILAVAVCAVNACTPCGACRQVMVEFGEDIPVWLASPTGALHETSLYKLIPDHFGPQDLDT